MQESVRGKRISFEDLAPGMVVAEDLRTPQGRLLLKKGSVVDDKHLKMCKIWGVVEVDVVGGQDDADAGAEASKDELAVIDPEIVSRLKRQAARFFSLADAKHGAVKELARSFVLRKAKVREFGVEAVPVADASSGFPAGPTLKERGIVPAKIAAKEAQLSSLPEVFHRIVKELRSPSSSTAYLADLIGKDVSLSAKLLRTVNTPYFGYQQTIDNLSRAIMILGSRQLTGIALGISVVDHFKGVPSSLFDMKSFWRHSVACGVIGRLLGAEAGCREDEPFFVAGLLHDIGRLVMLKDHPEESRAAFALCNTEELSLFEAEKRLWGFDHAEVGGALLEAWKFPRNLTTAVSRHHVPAAAGYAPEAAIIHIADVAAHALDLGANPMRRLPRFDSRAWDALKLSRFALRPIVQQVDAQLETILNVFFQEDD